MNQNLANDLAGLTALDESGTKGALGGFWADRAAIVGFVRYFDSASCRKLVTALRDAQAEIEKRGARLLVVGGVQADAIGEFREAVGYRGPLMVDPSLDVFRAALMVAGAAPKPQAQAQAAPPASGGFFGRMKNALNADVGKLMKMDVKDALTADLETLGQQGGQPAQAAPSGPITPHDMAVFGLGPKEAVSYEWRARAAGDMPKIPDLLAALTPKV